MKRMLYLPFLMLCFPVLFQNIRSGMMLGVEERGAVSVNLSPELPCFKIQHVHPIF